MSRPTLAALVLLAAVTVGGCGGEDKSPSSQGPTSSAAATTGGGSAAGPGLKAGATIDGSELAKRLTDAMVAARSGKIAITSGGSTGTGHFVIEGAATKAHMTMPLQGQSLEIITLGKVIYIKGIPNSPKPWVKVDPDADDPLSKMMAQSLGQMDSDPRALVGHLDGSTATVTSVSGGVTTYEVPITSEGTGTATAPPVLLTIVVDDKDLPQKMSASVGGEDVEVAYSDWGAAVTVEEPPASEVGSFEMPTATS